MECSAFPRPRSLLRVASALCLLSFVGCPVDSRSLELAEVDGGQGGSSALLPSGGGPDSGHAGTSSGTPGLDASPDQGEGGAAGAADHAPVTVDGCLDLDGNGVSDCTETSVSNAEFASDVAEWTADAQTGDSFSTTLAWDPKNAWGSEPSGSAKVTVSGALDFNGAALRAATQCLAVSPAQLLVVYANAQLDKHQDPAGSVEIDVSFFDTADCSGLASRTFSTPPPQADGADTWLTLHAGAPTGADTKSALIKLGVVKPFRVESLAARFDNVLVRVQSP